MGININISSITKKESIDFFNTLKSELKFHGVELKWEIKEFNRQIHFGDFKSPIIGLLNVKTKNAITIPLYNLMVHLDFRSYNRVKFTFEESVNKAKALLK